MGNPVRTDKGDRIPVCIEYAQFIVFNIFTLVEQLQFSLENAGNMGLL